MIKKYPSDFWWGVCLVGLLCLHIWLTPSEVGRYFVPSPLVSVPPLRAIVSLCLLVLLLRQALGMIWMRGCCAPQVTAFFFALGLKEWVLCMPLLDVSLSSPLRYPRKSWCRPALRQRLRVFRIGPVRVLADKGAGVGEVSDIQFLKNFYIITSFYGLSIWCLSYLFCDICHIDKDIIGVII